MSNVYQLYDDDKEFDVSYSLEAKELKKVFDSEKFIFVYQHDNGDVRFHSGKKLTVGDLTYLQKVANVKTDRVIEYNMFKDEDE